MAKFVTAAEAVKQIKDGAILATSGFVGGLVPETVLKEIQTSFKERFNGHLCSWPGGWW